MPRYRIVDMAGSERGIIDDERPSISLGEMVAIPDEDGTAAVVDLYDDEEWGREGGVEATLVLEIE